MVAEVNSEYVFLIHPLQDTHLGPEVVLLVVCISFKCVCVFVCTSVCGVHMCICVNTESNSTQYTHSGHKEAS